MSQHFLVLTLNQLHGVVCLCRDNLETPFELELLSGEDSRSDSVLCSLFFKYNGLYALHSCGVQNALAFSRFSQ